MLPSFGTAQDLMYLIWLSVTSRTASACDWQTSKFKLTDLQMFASDCLQIKPFKTIAETHQEDDLHH